jgi:DUF4097 and DUF4098 domain-containing protein YvlB
MADYSAMESFLEKNNLHYFTISLNSEKKNYEASNSWHSPDTPEEDISNSLEHHQREANDGYSKSNQRTNPYGTTLPLSKEIFKLNSLNQTTVKAGLYRAQIGLTKCYNG